MWAHKSWKLAVFTFAVASGFCAVYEGLAIHMQSKEILCDYELMFDVSTCKLVSASNLGQSQSHVTAGLRREGWNIPQCVQKVHAPCPPVTESCLDWLHGCILSCQIQLVCDIDNAHHLLAGYKLIL